MKKVGAGGGGAEMFPFITILEGGKRENKIKVTGMQSLMSSCQYNLAADLSF